MTDSLILDLIFTGQTADTLPKYIEVTSLHAEEKLSWSIERGIADYSLNVSSKKLCYFGVVAAVLSIITILL